MIRTEARRPFSTDKRLNKIFSPVGIIDTPEKCDECIVVLETAHARTWQLRIVDSTSRTEVPIQEAIGGETIVIHVKALVRSVLVAISQQAGDGMVVLERLHVIDGRLESFGPRQLVPLKRITHALPFGGRPLVPILTRTILPVIPIVAYVRSKHRCRKSIDNLQAEFCIARKCLLVTLADTMGQTPQRIVVVIILRLAEGTVLIIDRCGWVPLDGLFKVSRSASQ